MRNTGSPSRDSRYRARARRSPSVAPGRGGCAGAHDDLARDRAALGRRAVARELRVPRPRGRRRDLDEPEIRRPAVPLTRCGRDASIGRDQRKLALERLLRGEDDAQRRALPRRDRRGQDRELGRVFAAAGWTFGLCVRTEKRRRKMHPRSATMLSQQQQTGVQETIEPPGSLDAAKEYRESLWLNHGKIYRQANATATSPAA